MSTAIESVYLTSMQVLVLQEAAEEPTGDIFVSRQRLVAARGLMDRGLGHVSDRADGSLYFTITAAGRDQLRIRQ